MYHLKSLFIKQPTADRVKLVISKILTRKEDINKLHSRIDNYFKMGQDYDEDFSPRSFKCVAPELMDLPVGAEVEVSFKRDLSELVELQQDLGVDD